MICNQSIQVPISLSAKLVGSLGEDKYGKSLFNLILKKYVVNKQS
jgi:hypothetical protein